MAVWTWNVTVAEVAGQIGGAAISATSEPTDDTVEAWIEQHSSELNALLRSRGVTPEGLTGAGDTAEDYARYRGAVLAIVAARWHEANRNGDTTLAELLRRQWQDLRSDIIHAPRTTTGAAGGCRTRTNLTEANKRTSSWNRTTGYR